MTCSATLRHNAGKRWRTAIAETIALKGLEGGRPARGMRGLAERKAGALRRAKRLLALAAGGVAAALAASLACAEAGPAQAPVLLPEAQPSLGELGDPSPVVAVFNASGPLDDGAPILALLASPKLDFMRIGESAAGDDAAHANRAERQANEAADADAAPWGFAPAPGPEGAVSETPSGEDNAPPGFAAAPIAPPLSPLESALAAALERLVARGDRPNPLGAGDWLAAREAIAAFYAARDYAPVWVGEDGLTDAGRSALAQLRRAGDDGLDLSQFALPRDVGPGLDVDALAEAETTIASAVVAYAEQASGSRVAAARVWPWVRASPSVAGPGAALAATAAAEDPGGRLADFNPPQKGYRDLREELKRLSDAAPGRLGALERGGLSDATIGANQEAGKGRRGAKGAAGGRVDVASADAAFGFGYGSLARKRAALLANMEMWRWEPRDMGERRIEVNIADFSVAVMDGDTIVHEARAIVGKPETPTPVFSNVMRYILINPSWQVPDSIIQKEMLSKLDYLSRHGYEVKTVGRRLTVRQLPGESNALGRIAFMFPNDHSIYLHDTPSRELFDEETRAFSHGCIRVEDPLSLAELVLGGEAGGWPEKRIEGAIGGRERTVFLPRPLPVHIEYFTEFVDEVGELRERPDVYGLTRRVEGAIAASSQD
jgi:murein L,D-transpeptidase YcbB/YkuD